MSKQGNNVYDWDALTPHDEIHPATLRMMGAAQAILGTVHLDEGTTRDAVIAEIAAAILAVGGVGARTTLGAQFAYIRTDAGTKDLLAAAAVDRIVMIVVTITTAFATGDGAQPTLTLDEESTAAKFAASAKFVTAAATTTFAFAGTLIAGKKLQATLVAATGTTSTGAYRIDVLATG